MDNTQSPQDRQPLTGAKKEAYETLMTKGEVTVGPYHFTADKPRVMVRDTRIGLLVAYSDSRPDFVSSAEEFIRDYVR